MYVARIAEPGGVGPLGGERGPRPIRGALLLGQLGVRMQQKRSLPWPRPRPRHQLCHQPRSQAGYPCEPDNHPPRALGLQQDGVHLLDLHVCVIKLFVEVRRGITLPDSRRNKCRRSRRQYRRGHDMGLRDQWRPKRWPAWFSASAASATMTFSAGAPATRRTGHHSWRMRMNLRQRRSAKRWRATGGNCPGSPIGWPMSEARLLELTDITNSWRPLFPRATAAMEGPSWK